MNNAGITMDSTLLKMTEDQWDKVIDVNLKGVYICGQTNYAATKWGVIGMTKIWAKELGKKGVRSNAVAPGFISTPMVKKMPENVIEMMKGKAPLGTLGEPEDIANAYVFLASDEAKFITGAVLEVTGGVVL